MAAKRARQIGADDCIDLAGCEEIVEGPAGRVGRDLHRFDERHHRRLAVASWLVHRALNPFDAGQFDAEIVLHQAADEDRGGLGVKRNADALAFEFFGGGDAAAIDNDKAVPKYPRCEYGQRDEWQLLRREPADIFRARHLTDIKLQPVGHTIEDLPWIIENNKIKIDAVSFDVPGMERQHPVVETAGESDRQSGHFKRLRGICEFGFVLYYTSASLMSA